MNANEQAKLVNKLFKKTKEIILQQDVSRQKSQDNDEAENLLEVLNKI